MLRSKSKRVLLNCSRQSGKSTTASVKALHRSIFFPGSLILLVSPSLRQSSELFRKVSEGLDRMSIKPPTDEDNKLSVAFQNGSRIVSLPGSEATIRGFSGAALIIEDESSRVPDALYHALRPMLAVGGGALWCMTTPFGKRGHFYEAWTGPNKWERVEIPATKCPRISPEFLEEERLSMPEWWFLQEYMCQFGDTIDGLFTHDQIMDAHSSDIEPLFGGGLLGDGTSVDVKTLFGGG